MKIMFSFQKKKKREKKRIEIVKETTTLLAVDEEGDTETSTGEATLVLHLLRFLRVGHATLRSSQLGRRSRRGGRGQERLIMGCLGGVNLQLLLKLLVVHVKRVGASLGVHDHVVLVVLHNAALGKVNLRRRLGRLLLLLVDSVAHRAKTRANKLTTLILNPSKSHASAHSLLLSWRRLWLDETTNGIDRAVSIQRLLRQDGSAKRNSHLKLERWLFTGGSRLQRSLLFSDKQRKRGQVRSHCCSRWNRRLLRLLLLLFQRRGGNAGHTRGKGVVAVLDRVATSGLLNSDIRVEGPGRSRSVSALALLREDSDPLLKDSLGDKETVINQRQERDLVEVDLGNGQARDLGPCLVRVGTILLEFGSKNESSQEHATATSDRLGLCEDRRGRGRGGKGKG